MYIHYTLSPLSFLYLPLIALRSNSSLCSVSQTSLEQIFNSFAKQQEEESLLENTDDDSDRPVAVAAAVAAAGDPAKDF